MKRSCPLCGKETVIKINKKSRPFLRCDDCGVLMFINKQRGIDIINDGLVKKVSLKRNTVGGGTKAPRPGESQRVFEEQKKGYQPFQKQVANRAAQNPAVSNKPTDTTGKRIGRNDSCYCGAKKADGKPIKYKNCHGK